MKKFFRTFLMLAMTGLFVLSCSQDSGVGDVEPIDDTAPNHGAKADAVALTINAGGSNEVSVRMKKDNATSTLTAILAKEVENDVILNIDIDREYMLDSELELLPDDYYKVDSDFIKIKAGDRGGELDYLFYVDKIPYGVSYVLPLVIEPENSYVDAGEKNRVVFTVSHAPDKDVEVILYYEVNNVNPLNAGEVLLEDGSPFFDYVVLFAYNINYNPGEDRVFLHSNANCQALLDEADTYLKPLRQKGIKVLMGILGNHDAAGLCQLSDWGCSEFAKEVAQAVKMYGMDGVALDDEYSEAAGSGKWFASKSYQAGSRMCYEMKKAMKEAKCDDSIVHVFQYGYLSSLRSVDGADPSTFVDQMVGNYGSAGSVQGSMTKKSCSGGSYECNNGQYPSETTARNIKNNGYGYIMYFNPDPAVKPGYYGENGYFAQAARGLYNQGLKPMAQWWKKIDEGEYDPKPYTSYPW